LNTSTIRLGIAHQYAIYALAALLLASGGLWLLLHYFVRVAGEFGPQIHPLEPWCLRLHGLSSALFLVAFGSVLPLHVRRAWAVRRNRTSGTLFLSTLALLALSGVGLYYVGGETARTLLSALHWVVGLGLPPLMAWHIWRGRTWLRAQQHTAAATQSELLQGTRREAAGRVR
jgi:hypothetical protein